MAVDGLKSVDFVDETALLEVRLLGPPEVKLIGGAALTHQQQALLAYLAVCGPASAEDMEHALWGGRVMSASRFPNLLAEVRAVVGTGHLPRCEDGYYRLSGFGCDLLRLETVATVRPQRRRSATTRQMAIHSVLGEIRGVPLHRTARAGRGFWTWLEACYVLRASIERHVVALGLETSSRHESIGSDQAIWALEQALRAVPDDKELAKRLAGLYARMGSVSSARTITDSWAGPYGDLGQAVEKLWV